MIKKRFLTLLIPIVLAFVSCRDPHEDIKNSEIYKYIGIYPKMTYYYLSEKGLMISMKAKNVTKEGRDLILSSEMKIGIFSNKTFIGETQEFKIIITPEEVKYVFENEEGYVFQTVLRSPITNNNTWFDNYISEDQNLKIENKIISTNSTFKIYPNYIKTTNQNQKSLIEVSNCLVIERKTKYQTIRNYFNREIGFLGSEYLPKDPKIKPTIYRLYRITLKQ